MAEVGEKSSDKNAMNAAVRRDAQIHWVRLGIALIGLVIISLGLTYVLQKSVAGVRFPLQDFASVAYLVVFVVSLISNLTIIAPVPFAISIMIAAATEWNPVLVALAASIGGSLGELSGYYAGYLGKKIALSQDLIEHSRVEYWIQRYGVWAIAGLAFQPIIPFDLGGLVAGAAKMPLRKFLLALFAGKFPKYLIFTYAGIGVIHFMPSWLH